MNEIDPLRTPGLMPAERLLLVVLADDPERPESDISLLTGLELTIIRRTIRELRRRKLIDRARGAA